MSVIGINAIYITFGKMTDETYPSRAEWVSWVDEFAQYVPLDIENMRDIMPDLMKGCNSQKGIIPMCVVFKIPRARIHFLAKYDVNFSTPTRYLSQGKKTVKTIIKNG